MRRMVVSGSWRTSRTAVEDRVIARQLVVHHVRMILVLQVFLHLHLINLLVRIATVVLLTRRLIDVTADLIIG